MNSSIIKNLIRVLIGLAIIGGIYTISTNPTGLFKSLLNGLIVFAVILALFFFIRKGNESPEQKKYSKAVKHSKRRWKNPNPKAVNQLKKELKNNPEGLKNRTLSNIKKKRDSSHLTVIEGKKKNKKAQ